MKKNWFRALLCAALTVFVGGCEEPAKASEPVRLIFDTDMGNDVDDALALGMVHSLQSRAEVELLAVTVTKDEKTAAPFVDVINHFYGRPDIAIGVVRHGATPAPSRYSSLVNERDSGELRYPHQLKTGHDAPEATGLLRRILANQPDGSVVIVQVGFSTNLARLLESSPDDISPLDGRKLVAAKVRLLSIMAGVFATDANTQPSMEYNVMKDIPAARRVVDDWPGPVIFSGYEVGAAIRFPASSIESDFCYVEHHPLVEAYYLYNPPPHERPTWDLTSVLYAVRPNKGYFGLSDPGRVSISRDGYTKFQADPNGQHRYLTVNAEQVIRAREAMVFLASQPPMKSQSE